MPDGATTTQGDPVSLRSCAAALRWAVVSVASRVGDAKPGHRGLDDMVNFPTVSRNKNGLAESNAPAHIRPKRAYGENPR